MNPVAAKPQAGILKTVYPQGGPVSQMNDSHPMINAIRARRNIVGKTQNLGL